MKSYSPRRGDLAIMQRRRSSLKCRPILISRQIIDLATELSISLDPDAVRNLVRLGIESLNQEAELEHTLTKLEEEKTRLASIFRRVASQSLRLESKCVGTRSRFGRISRDNRVLAMHLCARSPRGKREGQLRDELIQKYIMNYRNA